MLNIVVVPITGYSANPFTHYWW